MLRHPVLSYLAFSCTSLMLPNAQRLCLARAQRHFTFATIIPPRHAAPRTASDLSSDTCGFVARNGLSWAPSGLSTVPALRHSPGHGGGLTALGRVLLLHDCLTAFDLVLAALPFLAPRAFRSWRHVLWPVMLILCEEVRLVRPPVAVLLLTTDWVVAVHEKRAGGCVEFWRLHSFLPGRTGHVGPNVTKLRQHVCVLLTRLQFVLEGLGVCLGSPGRPLYALFLAAALWRLLELPPAVFTWAMALRLATLVRASMPLPCTVCSCMGACLRGALRGTGYTCV